MILAWRNTAMGESAMRSLRAIKRRRGIRVAAALLYLSALPTICSGCDLQFGFGEIGALEVTAPPIKTPSDEGVMLTVLVANSTTDVGEPDVGVAVDLVDGTRIEATTDPAGVAAIEVNSYDVIRSLITHKNGFAFYGMDGSLVARGFGFVVARAIPLASGKVEVSGPVINPAARENIIIATTTNGVSTRGGGTPLTSYSIWMYPDQTFDLVGGEAEPLQIAGQTAIQAFVNLVVKERVTTSDSPTLDFSSPAPPTIPFAGELAMPDDEMLRTQGVMRSLVRCRSATVGGHSESWADHANEVFVHTGQYVDVNWTPCDFIPYIAIYGSVNFALRQVQVTLDGLPSDGLVYAPYPNPPAMQSPLGEGPHPFDTPILFSLESGGASVDAFTFRIDDQYSQVLGLWQLNPWEATGVDLPSLPASSDPSFLDAAYSGALITFHRDGEGYRGSAGFVQWRMEPPE